MNCYIMFIAFYNDENYDGGYNLILYKSYNMYSLFYSII